MKTPRDILNELKWDSSKSLNRAEVFYIHRGAPGDYKIIKGNDILNLGRSFIELEDGHIPYHRVFQIIYEGEVIFSRDRS
ncbi:MAG: DUF504 domain-containing protein [Candidatus Saliniplasma sp.]